MVQTGGSGSDGSEVGQELNNKVRVGSNSGKYVASASFQTPERYSEYDSNDQEYTYSGCKWNK